MNNKKIVIIVGIFVVLGLIITGQYLYKTWKYKKIVSEIEIINPNLSVLKNGTYKGSFDALLVEAEVTVNIENKKIKSISLDKHKNDRGEAADVIPEKVVENQTLEVDTISGATNSSKVILKAIEEALETAK